MQEPIIGALSRVASENVYVRIRHNNSSVLERDLPGASARSRSAAAERPGEQPAASPGGVFIGESPYLDTKSLKCSVEDQFKTRISRLGHSKKRAVQMSDYLADLAPRRSEKLKYCASYLLFRDYFTVHKTKLALGMFCQQHLLCPLCARLRAGRLLRKYVERVQVVKKAKPGARVSMLDLTVKNGNNLAERTAHLLHGLKVLLGRARAQRFGKKGSDSEFGKFLGGVASVEVKRGKNSKQWHPHIHAVVLHDRKIDIAALRAEWLEITGDSQNVYLKNLSSEKSGNQEELANELQEVFKYAMKFSDMTLDDNWEAFRVLRKQRLLRPWGDLWGVKIPEGLADDNDLAADLPYVERLFRFRNGAYNESHDPNETAWLKVQVAMQNRSRLAGTAGNQPPGELTSPQKGEPGGHQSKPLRVYGQVPPVPFDPRGHRKLVEPRPKIPR